MTQPFDSDVMDEADAMDAPTTSADAALDAGGDEFDEFDAADSGDLAGGGADALGDGFGEGADDMALWNAFEEEVADGLDAADDDEFFGRLLGGLGRVAGGMARRGGRGRGGAAGGGAAGGGGGGLGGLLGGLGGLLGADEFDEGDEFDEYDEGDAYDEYDEADAWDEGDDAMEEVVASAMDAGDGDEFFRRLGRIARTVGRGIGSGARVVGPIASMIPIPQAQMIGRIANVAGRLLADGADEFEAFDEMVDGLDDDEIDAAYRCWPAWWCAGPCPRWRAQRPRCGVRWCAIGAAGCPRCGARRLNLRGPVTIHIRGR